LVTGHAALVSGQAALTDLARSHDQALTRLAETQAEVVDTQAEILRRLPPTGT
jgi:hypothetical protein